MSLLIIYVVIVINVIINVVIIVVKNLIYMTLRDIITVGFYLHNKHTRKHTDRQTI